MTVVDVATLAPSERVALLAMLRAEMARDNSYQETPFGRDVKRFIDWMRWKSRSEKTILNREGPLREFALHYASHETSDFDGIDGARLVEAFLIGRYRAKPDGGDYADNTRANRAGVFRAFFHWAYREGIVDKNPMDFIDMPRRRGKRRDAHPRDRIVKLISAQPQWRVRLAIALMARQGLRKSELAAVQLGHFNFARGTLSVFGKGSKFEVVKLFGDLAADVERYAQERAFRAPDTWRNEHLIFPRRAYKRGSWPDYTWHEREYRHRPLSSTAMQEWWRDCLDRAGLDPFPMHELRHTAGTDFHHGPAKKDYELTRQFLRHEDIATTVEYIHSPPAQLERAVSEAPDYWTKED